MNAILLDTHVVCAPASARYWLLADERGTFEKAARKRLEDTADKARALGMSNAEISVMIALSAVEAFLTRPRKGR